MRLQDLYYQSRQAGWHGLERTCGNSEKYDKPVNISQSILVQREFFILQWIYLSLSYIFLTNISEMACGHNLVVLFDPSGTYFKVEPSSKPFYIPGLMLVLLL